MKHRVEITEREINRYDDYTPIARGRVDGHKFSASFNSFAWAIWISDTATGHLERRSMTTAITAALVGTSVTPE